MCGKAFVEAAGAKNRVAKCHGYDRYIGVKILAGWGKTFGRPYSFAKSSLFGKDLHNICEISV